MQQLLWEAQSVRHRLTTASLFTLIAASCGEPGHFKDQPEAKGKAARHVVHADDTLTKAPDAPTGEPASLALADHAVSTDFNSAELLAEIGSGACDGPQPIANSNEQSIYVPDAPVRMYLDAAGHKRVIAAHHRTFSLLEAADGTLKPDCSFAALRSTYDTDAGAFHGWEWLTSPYAEDTAQGRRFFSLIHNEFHGSAATPCNESKGCAFMSILRATSPDGAAWSLYRADANEHLVAKPAAPYVPGAAQNAVARDPSNIVKNPADGKYYFFANVSSPANPGGALCVFRADDLLSDRWLGFDGSAFAANARDGGACAPILPVPINAGSLNYSKRLGRHILIGHRNYAADAAGNQITNPADPVFGFWYYLSDNADLTKWSGPYQLISTHSAQAVDGYADVYPSLIDPNGGLNFDTIEGDTAYDYFIRLFTGRADQARQIRRVPINIAAPPRAAALAYDFDGTHNLFAADKDGNVRQYRLAPSGWAEAVVIDGKRLVPGSSLAYTNDGADNLFAVDADGNVLQHRYAEGKWLTAGVTADRPFAPGSPLIYMSDGTANLFGVDKDGNILQLRYGGTAWLRAAISTDRAFPPGAQLAYVNDGTHNLFAVAKDGNIRQYRFGAGWATAQLTTTGGFPPGAALNYGNYAGQLNLFPVGNDGRIVQVALYQGQWLAQPVSAPGVRFVPGSAVDFIVQGGTFALFAIDAAGNATQTGIAAGAWTTMPITVGGPYVPGAPVSYMFDGTYNLFGADINGNVQQMRLTPAGWAPAALSATGALKG
jgi:hypothetical protein